MSEHGKKQVRFAVGGQHVVWRGGGASAGALVWGRLGDADLDGVLPREAGVLARANVVDLSRVTGLDPEVGDRLAARLEARIAALRDAGARLAIVRPGGFTGCIVAGVVVRAQASACQVFPALATALAWLGEPAVDPLWAQLSSLAEDGGVVARARAVLTQSGLRGEVDEVARALGMSGRSLQRALRAAGTGFRALKHALQLERARTLLRETDLKVEAVARGTGFDSVGHFTGFFRRRTGQPPARWRRQAALG